MLLGWEGPPRTLPRNTPLSSLDPPPKSLDRRQQKLGPDTLRIQSYDNVCSISTLGR